MKKICIIVLAICFGYLTLVISLGQEDSRDIILRRNFLVHRLSQAASPQNFFKIGTSQIAGEWTLGSLSMTAAALTNIAMQQPQTAHESSLVIARMIESALTDDVSHFDKIAWGEQPLNEEVLNKDEGHIGYYGHLNLMLGCYALLNNDGRFKDLHIKISNAIANRMQKYPHRHIETYPGETYPPDNTVSAASLKVADMTLGTKYAALLNEWIEQCKKLEDPQTGLIVFGMDITSGKPRQTARGSHAGWNSFYLPLVDEAYAALQYNRFKKFMLRRFIGFAGFKEYANGTLFWMDRDAGPVLFSIGVSATGFAVAGAQREGDRALKSDLLRSVELLGVSVTKGDERRYVASPIVGDAIMLAMKTACPWKPIGSR